ncbi:large subunit ribosomal protein L10 [Fusobacterium naviforme]|nr:50S ribosomal protein L10 [Fusobacterium naviforme]PSL10450.1 large subunit ribosomal protein L10 [Fusobacterium naviforme]STO28146.1 50S ribosomal protein L10 [Fusobacterium naviforme]
MRDSKIAEKQPVIKEIAELLDGAQSAVVVDYRGLTVEQDTQLRKQLREAGVVYKVFKNTMVRIAAEGTDFAQFDPYLEGPTALAVSKEDATAPARLLAKFAKTAPKLEIKGGVVEGTVYDAKGMAAIAMVPSREELLGRLFGSMQSPITNMARVLKQIAEKDVAPAEAAEAGAAE